MFFNSCVFHYNTKLSAFDYINFLLNDYDSRNYVYRRDFRSNMCLSTGTAQAEMQHETDYNDKNGQAYVSHYEVRNPELSFFCQPFTMLF